MQNAMKLDANETVFFQTELETVRSEAYEVQYPELQMASGNIFPISTDADPADEIISYEMFDHQGMAKVISNYADDLPMVGVSGKKVPANIRTIGDAYAYTIKDIKKAAKTGKSLPNMKAMAARKGNDLKIDAIGWYGSADDGIIGVFNHPNIPVGVNTGKRISDPTATPEEMYNIVANAITAQLDLTNGLEIADSIAFPVKEFAILSKTRFTDGSGQSVLKMLKENFPAITRWLQVAQLKAVTPRPSGQGGSTEIMMLWNFDRSKASLELPLPFQQMEPEKKNLTYKVDCYSMVAGLITPYPLSLSLTENI